MGTPRFRVKFARSDLSSLILCSLETFVERFESHRRLPISSPASPSHSEPPSSLRHCRSPLLGFYSTSRRLHHKLIVRHPISHLDLRPGKSRVTFTAEPLPIPSTAHRNNGSARRAIVE